MKRVRSHPERATPQRDRAIPVTRSPWLLPTAIAAGLCLLVLTAYSNSFSAGFALDSRQLVLNDPRVHDASAENVRLIINHSYWWPYGESGLYRPLTTLSYLLNYAVLGSADRPAGYHLFNLLVHIANAWLVWALAATISGQRGTAMAAAAIWSVLPLSTEAVTNIVGRADLLAALGVLGGLACYLKTRTATGGRRLLWLAALMLMTAVGVFAKESAVAVVGVVVLYELVWWNRSTSVPALARGVFAVALPIAIMLLQRAAVLGAADAAEFPFTDNPIGGAGFWQGRVTAVQVIWRYLFLLVWPAALSIEYSYNQVPLATGTFGDWLAVAALIAAVAAALHFRDRHRAAFFFAACAAIVFVPVSNLVVTSGTIMAERLAYLPSAGLVVAVSLVMFAFASTYRARLVLHGVVVVLVCAGSARTWVRNHDWKDDVTIWAAAVSASPQSAKAHRGYAEALSTADPTHANLDRVIAAGEESVRLLEPLPPALRSFTSFRQTAAAHLDRAEDLHQAASGSPLAPETRQSYDRALVLLQKALEIALVSNDPDSAMSVGQQAAVRRMSAAAYAGLGDSARAADEARRARQLDPRHPLTHRLLANAYLSAGDREQAALALMVGGLMTGDREVQRALTTVYRTHYGDSCALSTTPSGVVVNPACEIVRDHMCASSVSAIALYLQADQQTQADALRQTARMQWGCPIAP